MGLALDMEFNKNLKKIQTKESGTLYSSIVDMLLTLLSEEHYFGYVIVT